MGISKINNTMFLPLCLLLIHKINIFLGNLNNKLLNFSLTPETTKAAPVPMNAMQVQKPANKQVHTFCCVATL